MVDQARFELASASVDRDRRPPCSLHHRPIFCSVSIFATTRPGNVPPQFTCPDKYIRSYAIPHPPGQCLLRIRLVHVLAFGHEALFGGGQAVSGARPEDVESWPEDHADQELNDQAPND